MLQRLDPAAAARISCNDRQKLIRALEVCLLSGRPFTSVLADGRTRLRGYSPIRIGLQPPRAALYDRIGKRLQTMLEQGWPEEVAALLHAGVSPAAKPFEFIGYRELLEQRKTGQPKANVGDAIALATRRYAKRQLTWFRKEPDVHWIAGFGDDPNTLTAAVAFLEEQLHCASRTENPSDRQPAS
jgi:tRNA dimethylallyltransferase